jgi:hypothetical protein
MWPWITASHTHAVIAIYALSILYFMLGAIATAGNRTPSRIVAALSMPVVALIELLRGNIQGRRGAVSILSRCLLILFLPVGILVGLILAIFTLMNAPAF